jgi:hypothetical protein
MSYGKNGKAEKNRIAVGSRFLSAIVLQRALHDGPLEGWLAARRSLNDCARAGRPWGEGDHIVEEVAREVVSQIPNWLVLVLVASFGATLAAAILITTWVLARRLKRIKGCPVIAEFEWPMGAACQPGGGADADVDQVGRDPLPSGHTSRRLGGGTKCADGTVVVEQDPWP